MGDSKVAEQDQVTAARIRALAVTYRARAALYAALGHGLEESNCRALAEIHDERAGTLEQRATAAAGRAAASRT
jgi:hypothetical protein